MLENPTDDMTLAIASKKDLLPEFSLDAMTPDKIYNINSSKIKYLLLIY